MTRPQVITIDGPAGAGKSTLGDLLARRLGYLYFDTGIMYRALTLAATEHAVDPQDGAALAALAERITIDIQPPSVDDGRQATVLLDGRDVTWQLRSPAVERNVSHVAAHPAVRAVLRAQQRAIGLRGQVVMVGRDIGTIVMPDAALKVYLETSLDERARRRTEELHARGRDVPVAEVAADVARRDALDRHVLAPAADAIIINGDGISPEDEVALILERCDARVLQRTA